MSAVSNMSPARNTTPTENLTAYEEDIATELLQQRLDNLASNAHGAGEGIVNNVTIGTETMSTAPLVKRARKLLYRRFRVGVEDNRVFVGKFHCLDKQGNIILYDTVEFRPPPSPSTTAASSSSSSGDGSKSCSASAAPAEADLGTVEQRGLGLVLIPARCRTSCHIECSSIEEQFSLLTIA